GVDPTPSFTCCEGAKNIVLVANASMEDKMFTCDCLKQTAAFINPKPDRANDLPNNCRVRFPFEISSTFDCSSWFGGDCQIGAKLGRENHSSIPRNYDREGLEPLDVRTGP
ncbi:hypothetical protein L195_g029329, partial [Trifolium pratense]